MLIAVNSFKVTVEIAALLEMGKSDSLVVDDRKKPSSSNVLKFRNGDSER